MTGLFYRGRINSVYGSSGDGKTWIACAAITEKVQLGEPPMMIDFEDHADGMASRFVALSLDVAQIGAVLYRNPASGLGSMWGQAAMRASIDMAPTLVVIDSVGEAMAHAGIDSNSDTDVAAWMSQVKAITRWPSRPAVVLLDHIPKNNNPDAPTRGAIGSQRKLAAITGAAYRTHVVTPFSIDKPGAIKLVTEKDRLGTRARGSTAALVRFTPQGDGRLDVAICAPDGGEPAGGEPGGFRPTVLMEKVSAWLELYPGATGRQIEQGVEGKAAHLRRALACLVAEGFVEAESGARGAFHHTVRTPFRDTILPTASRRVPPRPDRVPGRGADPENDRVPRPFPRRDAGTRSSGRTSDAQEEDRPRPASEPTTEEPPW